MSDGFLVVDKEPGMTSHDVVAISRRALGTRKVGHAGTLDPMATGVLVLGFNNGTRLLQYITDGKKAYDATILLGVSTTTDDREGEVLATTDASHVTDADIRTHLAAMVGEIMQRPTSVSAIKIDGKRAYDLVRKGVEVDIPARPVTIHTLEILDIRRSESTIEIDISAICSAGTYIRAIARDLGEVLNVGGHLTSLRRTLVEPFTLDAALSIEQLQSGKFNTLDISAVAQSTFEVRHITEEEERELGFGRQISPNATEELTAAISASNQLIALLKNSGDKAKPVSVFAAAK